MDSPILFIQAKLAMESGIYARRSLMLILLRHYMVGSCLWRVECQLWWFNEKSFVGNYCNSTEIWTQTARRLLRFTFTTTDFWLNGITCFLYIWWAYKQHKSCNLYFISISSEECPEWTVLTYCNNSSQWNLFYIYAPATWSTLQILFWWSLKSSPIISTGRWNVWWLVATWSSI